MLDTKELKKELNNLILSNDFPQNILLVMKTAHELNLSKCHTLKETT